MCFERARLRSEGEQKVARIIRDEGVVKIFKDSGCKTGCFSVSTGHETNSTLRSERR